MDDGIIDVQSAIDAALVEVKGEAVSVAADTVDDTDVFSIEVNGLDGKSYDVFVALDGTVIGWDEYEVKTEETEVETSEPEIQPEEKTAITGEEAELVASLMEFETLVAEIDD